MERALRKPNGKKILMLRNYDYWVMHRHMLQLVVMKIDGERDDPKWNEILLLQMNSVKKIISENIIDSD